MPKPLFSSSEDHKGASSPPEAEQDQVPEISASIVTQEDPAEEQTKSQVEEEEEERKKEEIKEVEEKLESEGWAVFRADGVEFQLDLKERVEKARKEKEAEKDEEEDDEDVERYFIGELGHFYSTFEQKSYSDLLYSHNAYLEIKIGYECMN